MLLLFGGGQFVRRAWNVPLAMLRPRWAVGEDGAAIVFPALDFGRRHAVCRRCRADRLFQIIDYVGRHVALLHSCSGRAGAAAEVLKSAELGGGASDGEPAIPAFSLQYSAVMSPLFQYLGRCETAHFLACSIGGRSVVAWRSCRTIGKASIRSRQACTTGKLAYIVLPSGVRPNE